MPHCSRAVVASVRKTRKRNRIRTDIFSGLAYPAKRTRWSKQKKVSFNKSMGTEIVAYLYVWNVAFVRSHDTPKNNGKIMWPLDMMTFETQRLCYCKKSCVKRITNEKVPDKIMDEPWTTAEYPIRKRPIVERGRRRSHPGNRRP